jgi:hypothetical protein
MAVGKQSSSDVTVTITDSPGGTARQIKNFIMELGEAAIEVETVESTAFGDAWREHVPTGMRNVPEIPISGHFDTTATTGPHVTLRPGDADAAPNSVGRELVIVFGDSKTFTVTGHLVRYGAKAIKASLTGFASLFRPTGAGVWS